MRFLPFLLALILSGCAATVHQIDQEIIHRGDTIAFHADTSFTPSERQCLRTSTDNWFIQTGGKVDMSITYDYDHNDLYSQTVHATDDKLERWLSTDEHVLDIERNSAREPDGSMITLYGATHSHLSVRTPANPIVIDIVADVLNPHTCVLTAMHEMGHGLDMPHLPSSKGNIMYPSVYPQRTECLKDADIKNYLSLHPVSQTERLEFKACPDQAPDLFPAKLPNYAIVSQ